MMQPLPCFTTGFFGCMVQSRTYSSMWLLEISAQLFYLKLNVTKCFVTPHLNLDITYLSYYDKWRGKKHFNYIIPYFLKVANSLLQRFKINGGKMQRPAGKKTPEAVFS